MSNLDIFSAARRHMVDSQLRPNKVNDDRILAAMGTIPRELFVPALYRDVAYMDEDIAVAPGRYLTEPLVLARLAQAAEITGTDKVLIVGAATGYSAAILARLAGSVIALDVDAALVATAKANLLAVGAGNVSVVSGAMEFGAADNGPYDVILVDGAIEEVPDVLQRQLVNHGRLLTVVTSQRVGDAVIVRRTGDLFARRGLFNAQVRPLPGFARAVGFVF